MDAPDRLAVAAAIVAAASTVAAHVLGKAVRDALFLAAFPVAELPYFILGTGLVSVLAVGAYTRLNTRFGPRLVVPLLAIATAFWLVPLWLGARTGQPWALGGLYPWTTVRGTLLTSGFWAVLGERFDPRRARRIFGWVGVATTVGGLAGGLGAHEALHVVEPEGLLLLLSALYVVTAVAIGVLGRRHADGAVAAAAKPAKGGVARGVAAVLKAPYLRDIALLVTIGTVGGTLADYVLKDAAAQALTGKRQLAEFFSLFHGIVGAITLGVQLLLARPLLSRKGLAASLSVLPLWLATGALGVAFFPVTWAAAALRGGETAIRNSFHRSGYELLFVPLAASIKRLVKPIIDTLVERVADGLGALTILLAVGVAHFSTPRLALFVSALGGLELLFVLRVRKGYVETLSSNLAARALELENVASAADDDATAREAVRATLLDLRSTELRETIADTDLGKSFMKSLQFDPELTAVLAKARGVPLGVTLGVPPPPPSRARAADDAVVDLVRDLVDRSPEVVRAALLRWDGRDRRVVPFLVRLLERDDLHLDAIHSLARAGDKVSGTLVDYLDDPSESFAVRRRLPRALAGFASQTVVDALARALRDPRFDVRYHAGAALDVIQSRAGKRPAESVVWAAVRAEVEKSRPMWQAQQLLDDPAGEEGLSGVVERRGAHSLRHVFRLLGLVLDAKPLGLSYRAVQGDDPHFRGVGLEYLENVLPPDVKRALWPLIGDEDAPPISRSGRALAEVLRELAHDRSGR